MVAVFGLGAEDVEAEAHVLVGGAALGLEGDEAVSQRGRRRPVVVVVVVGGVAGEGVSELTA